MHHITRAAAATAIAVAITTAGPAAFAETTSAEDPRGDSRRAFDITSIRLANNERAVRIRLDFVDVDRSRIGSVTAQVDTGRALGDGLFIEFRRDGEGGWTKQLQRAPMYGEAGDDTIRCVHLTLTWSKDQAVIRLPRRCMGDVTDRVRAAAAVENSRSSQGDNAPRQLFTAWADRG
jgi:hypothetical protein